MPRTMPSSPSLIGGPVGATRDIAEFTVQTRFDDLPTAVVHEATATSPSPTTASSCCSASSVPTPRQRPRLAERRQP
jgi:hypothetical protein